MLRPSTTKGIEWGHDHGELIKKVKRGEQWHFVVFAPSATFLRNVTNINAENQRYEFIPYVQNSDTMTSGRRLGLP
jgi:hypothetical protein